MNTEQSPSIWEEMRKIPGFWDIGSEKDTWRVRYSRPNGAYGDVVIIKEDTSAEMAIRNILKSLQK